MLWKLLAGLGLALACLPAPRVWAAEDEEANADETAAAASDEGGEGEELAYDRDGWYAGIGGGYAFAQFDRGDADDSAIVNLRAGYHFLRFAALEAQLEYLPQFGAGTGDYNNVDTALWSAWLNMKGYPTAPWTAMVQPYGLFGIAWMWSRQTGSAINGSDEHGGFAMRVGGGIDFYVTRNIVLTADSSWVVPTGSPKHFQHVTVGGALQYRF